jgi:ABC-type enterochelin transport system permease subunit
MEKNHMSDTVIALIIPIAVIAIFLGWVPFLNLVCPPCGRTLELRRLEKLEPKRNLVGARFEGL